MNRSLWSVGLLAAAGCAASSQGALSAADGSPVTDEPRAAAERRFTQEVERIQAEQADGTVDWSRVASEMEAVVGQLPSFPWAWYNLGVAREALGKPAAAEQAYSRALTERPDFPEAAQNLARLLAESDRKAEAVRVLEALVAMRPDAPEARVALASHRLLVGDFESARRLCEEALAYDPTLSRAYCVLAETATRREAWGRTRLLVAQGLKLDPDSACLQEALGEAHLGEGRLAMAIQAFQRAVALDPSRVGAHGRLAEIGVAQKNFALAARHASQVAELEGAGQKVRASGYAILGIALKASGDFEAAREAYLDALELDPEAPAAHFNLGLLELRQFSNLDRAEAHFRAFMQRSDARSDEAFQLLKEIETRRKMMAAAEAAAAEAEAESSGGDPLIPSESESDTRPPTPTQDDFE